MTPAKLATYAWKTSALADDLARHRLSERDQFVLIFIGQIVVFVAAYIGLFMGMVQDWVSFAEALVLLGITSIGIRATYQGNGGDQGHDYVRRLFILSVPLAVKFSLLSWPVFYALTWVVTFATLKMTDNVFELSMRVLELGWNIGLTTLFYSRLTHWMKFMRQPLVAGGIQRAGPES